MAGGPGYIDFNGSFITVDKVTGAVTTDGTSLIFNGNIDGDTGIGSRSPGQLTLNGNNSFGSSKLNDVVVHIGSDTALGRSYVELSGSAGAPVRWS